MDPFNSASNSKTLSKKRQYPYSQEEANTMIIQQSVRRLKICSDLTHHIEMIARSSVAGAARPQFENINEDGNQMGIAQNIRIKQRLPLNVKKFNSRMQRKRIQLFPYQIKKIISLRYGVLNAVLNHPPLTKLKDISLQVGVKICSINHVLRRYRRNGFQIHFIPRTNIRKPRNDRKLRDSRIISYLTSKKVLRMWAHHSLVRRCQLINDYFQISMSRTCLANFYKRERISYTMMKKTLAHKFNVQHLHIDRINFIDKITEYFLAGREIMFFDESSTHLWETRSKIWQPKDDKLRVAIPSSRGSGVTILGTVSNQDDYFRFYIAAEKQTTCNVLVKDFFVNLNQHRSLNGVILVLDRHPAHQTETEIVLQSLGCTTLKLPVNTSIFNPVEMCWAWVKNQWRNLLLQQDQDQLLNIQREWMEKNLKAICNSMPKNHIQAFIRSTTKAMYEYAKSEVPCADDPNEPRF